MKIRFSTILMAFAMLLCVSTSCDDGLIEVDTMGTIAGSVVELNTGDPVQNATVTLSPSGKNTYTGSDGAFEFLDLDARQYTITVQKTGYETNRKQVTTAAGGVVEVKITLKPLE